MERILVGMLVGAAVEKMDFCHQRSHRGIVISKDEVKQVRACREFLAWFEKRSLS